MLSCTINLFKIIAKILLWKFEQPFWKIDWQDTLKDLKFCLKFLRISISQGLSKQMLKYTVNKECPWMLMAVMVVNVKN